MDDLDKSFKQIVCDTTPVLRELGFRGRGRRFRLEHPDISVVVDFWKQPRTLPKELHFQVLAGISFRALDPLYRVGRDVTALTVAECDVQYDRRKFMKNLLYASATTAAAPAYERITDQLKNSGSESRFVRTMLKQLGGAP